MRWLLLNFIIMTTTSLKLIDLYNLNPDYFNTDEKVQEEVNKIIEYRNFRKQTLYLNNILWN